MRSLRTIFHIIFCLAFSLSASAQPSAAERPRLVVGIMVDGLQQKHLGFALELF
ncbi:MAG: hypothetical protein QM800_04120 [Paludibacter sp.]